MLLLCGCVLLLGGFLPAMPRKVEIVIAYSCENTQADNASPLKAHTVLCDMQKAFDMGER